MSTTNHKKTKNTIELTREQYRDLIALVALGNSVMGILGDVTQNRQYKRDSIRMEELESHLLAAADAFASFDLVDEFSDKPRLDIDYYELFIHDELLKKYDVYTFWETLMEFMGKRDFERTETKEEKKEIKRSGGMLPHRISEIYEKYRQEFEQHGIERLEVENSN